MNYQRPAESWNPSYNIDKYCSSTKLRNSSGGSGSSTSSDPSALIKRLASENAVVIFSMSTCCMCLAIKKLFCGMGVNPMVYELDQLQDPTSAKEMENALVLLLTGSSIPTSTSTAPPVPVVFIGGKLVGAMEAVLASHINGTLVPLLKQAGALWL